MNNEVYRVLQNGDLKPNYFLYSRWFDHGLNNILVYLIYGLTY